MANQVFTVTVPDIHQGYGQLWYNTLKPPLAARMLIDTNGNPQNPPSATWASATTYALGQEVWDGTNVEICLIAGTSGGTAPTWPAIGGTVVDGTVTWKNLGVPLSMGSSEGAATFHMEAKIEEVAIDQETGPVDAVMTAENAYIEVTLKESAYKKIQAGLAHGSYLSGTDTGLPANAQNYEEITVGGLVTVGGVGIGAFPAVSLVSPRRGFSSPGKFMVATLYGAYAKDAYQVGFTRAKEATWKVRFEGLANLWRAQGDRVAQFYRQT